MTLKLHSELQACSEDAKVLAVQFHMLCGDMDKARDFMSQLETVNSPQVQVTRGWLEFLSGKEQSAVASSKSYGSAYT